MISPSWNCPRTHLFDAPVVTTDVANESSLRYSGPTRRGSQQVDLRGFELLSDCVVELIARAYCGNCKVIATAIDAGQKTLSGAMSRVVKNSQVEGFLRLPRE